MSEKAKRAGRFDVPVKYRDGQWEYLPPGTIMAKRGIKNQRWALRLCRGSSVTLPNGKSVKVMTWEEEARELRKQLNEYAVQVARQIREEQARRAADVPEHDPLRDYDPRESDPLHGVRGA